MPIGVQMAQGEVLDQRVLSVYSGERIDGLEGRPTRSMQKFGKLIGHSEKATGPSHTQTNIMPVGQRSYLFCQGDPHSSCAFTHPFSMTM